MNLAEVGRDKRKVATAPRKKQSPPRQMCWGRGLELAPHLDLLKGLDDVAHLQVVVVLDIDTALET